MRADDILVWAILSSAGLVLADLASAQVPPVQSPASRSVVVQPSTPDAPQQSADGTMSLADRDAQLTEPKDQPVTTARPDAGDVSGPPARTTEQLEGVVVTARGRAEGLGRLPDAVTVISAQEIDRAGVQNTQDLSRLAPNFDFRTGFRAGAAQITVRGLTTPQGGELPIALVVDGVQLPGADFFNQDLLDVAQVQVLRGPQGALYGQGAVAGAMLITTRAPTNDLVSTSKASYENGNTYHLVESVSGPIVEDTLFYRVVAAYRKSDGTINDVNGHGRNFIESPFIRGELRFDGENGLRAILAANYNRGVNGAIYQDRAPTRSDGTVDIDNKNVNIVSNIIGTETRQTYGSSLRLEQDLGGGLLSSTSAYDRLRSTAFGDADFTTADTLSQTNVYNIRLFNEDLRYTSAGDRPLRYVVGAFYQKRTIDESLAVPFLPASGRTGFAARSSDSRGSTSYAAFAQVNYDLTSKAEVTGALRYDFNDRDFNNNFTAVHLQQNFNKIQPKVSLAYNWSSDFMTYATYAIGFRSGDFNAASSVFAGPVIQAETSRNYELGAKARFLNGRVAVSAAAFHIDLKNGQFFFASLTPPSQNTININASHVDGAELEVKLRPVNSVDLQAALGVSHSVIDNFNNSGLNDHSPFPTVPAYTARIAASYDLPLNSSFTLTPRFDVYRRGQLYFLPGSTLRSGPYTDENFRLSLSTRRWSFAGYVANIGNERHAEVASSNLRTVSAPRTYGGELTMSFD